MPRRPRAALWRHATRRLVPTVVCTLPPRRTALSASEDGRPSGARAQARRRARAARARPNSSSDDRIERHASSRSRAAQRGQASRRSGSSTAIAQLGAFRSTTTATPAAASSAARARSSSCRTKSVSERGTSAHASSPELQRVERPRRSLLARSSRLAHHDDVQLAVEAFELELDVAGETLSAAQVAPARRRSVSVRVHARAGCALGSRRRPRASCHATGRASESRTGRGSRRPSAPRSRARRRVGAL